MFDKLTKIWRPSATETKPPFPDKAKDCRTCTMDEALRENWEPHHGTCQDWIELLHTTTLDDCNAWLEKVLNIRWTLEDRRALLLTYMFYVSTLSAKKWRET